MTGEVKISVRALVEYAYRSGSIESGFRTATALTEGTKAHQKVQKTYGDSDQKEVFLQTEILREGIVFVLEGRCDGLLFGPDGDEVTIDEIKSSTGDPRLVEENRHPVHWAQAVCYAYIYAKQNSRNRMKVQLTYVQVGTEEQQRYVREYTYEELEAAVLEAVRLYAPYAAMQLHNRRERDASIRELPFPYPAYREGQRQFAGSVYKTIKDGHKLFANAPTGTGKTISTLFPSVKAVGEGLLQRIFYLTAKTLTRTAAEEAFSLMIERGLHMRTVTLTAKDKICFREEVDCRKEMCEFADGYYDRVNGAVLDMLTHEKLMNRSVIETYARKHKVCPFEFSLDAAYAADAVICDYNYIFDPKVYLKRLPEEVKKQTALLIDEAHNLVDRGREMFSAELTKAPFLQLKRDFKGRNSAVEAAAKAVNDYFIAFRKEQGGGGSFVLREVPEELPVLLEAFAQQAERELSAPGQGGEKQQLLLDTYFAAQSFLRTAKYYDERYVTFAEVQRSDVRLKLLCLDPSALLAQMGKGYRAHVFFSATLSPFSYYMDMLGGGEDDFTVSIPWPFRQEQLDVWIEPLSTRYKDRDKTKLPISRLLGKLVREKPGNYLVFFPSYEYMREVAALFLEQERGPQSAAPIDGGAEGTETAAAAFEDGEAPAAAAAPPELAANTAGGAASDKAGQSLFEAVEVMLRDRLPASDENQDAGSLAEKPEPGGSGKEAGSGDGSRMLRILVQQPSMPEEERESFLASFRADPPHTLIGFAVMGGIFSEGIDLRGDRLTGVVVVGVGLPQVGPERNIIKDHFDRDGRSGFDYAYVFPGINKVMQAGGRLIRTENDYGTLVLIDDRFLQRRYQSLLPPEWRHFTIPGQDEERNR
ncbi:ATP-dependent DNA helicase [Paenibacillus sp. UNC499MF]|uniref:ATP-dependent DNA helicase n=1 Tax=Paenibacillus sp. UNC499MF TaxID=1502751 RepID=UPI0008A04768|nr:ATP-dependent DNA helicase [Paenibacillus sp. UNC499MF]SEG27742.1 Rad3-related DNA helicase [Paenibacillus sp. UNC499MF]